MLFGAAKRVVSFEVKAVERGNWVCLKSTTDNQAPTAFVAKIAPSVVKGDPEGLAKKYEGKVIRVRGTVQQSANDPPTVEVGMDGQVLLAPTR